MIDLPPLSESDRDQLISECVSKGLECRFAFRALHDHWRIMLRETLFKSTPHRDNGWLYIPSKVEFCTWSDYCLRGFLYLSDAVKKAYSDGYPDDWDKYLDIDTVTSKKEFDICVWHTLDALLYYWRDANNDGVVWSPPLNNQRKGQGYGYV